MWRTQRRNSPYLKISESIPSQPGLREALGCRAEVYKRFLLRGMAGGRDARRAGRKSLGEGEEESEEAGNQGEFRVANRRRLEEVWFKKRKIPCKPGH